MQYIIESLVLPSIKGNVINKNTREIQKATVILFTSRVLIERCRAGDVICPQV